MGSHPHFSPHITKRRPTDAEQGLLEDFFPPGVRKLLQVYTCKAVFSHSGVTDRYAILRMGADDNKRYFVIRISEGLRTTLVDDPNNPGGSYITDMRANAEYMARKLIQYTLDERSRPNRTLVDRTLDIIWDMLRDKHPGLVPGVGEAASCLKYVFVRPLAGPGAPLRLMLGQNPVAMAQVIVDLLHREPLEQFPPEAVAELLESLEVEPPESMSLTEEGWLKMTWCESEA